MIIDTYKIENAKLNKNAPKITEELIRKIIIKIKFIDIIKSKLEILPNYFDIEIECNNNQKQLFQCELKFYMLLFII